MRSNLRITWRQISSAVLSLLVVFAIWIQPARAQSQDSRQQEIQQLKDKLEQLDQMMKDARAELNALEGAEQHPPSARPAAQGPVAAKEASAHAEPVIAVPSEAVIAAPQTAVVPLEGERRTPRFWTQC